MLAKVVLQFSNECFLAGAADGNELPATVWKFLNDLARMTFIPVVDGATCRQMCFGGATIVISQRFRKGR
uniref:Uncharacterized protein n=1 Tax=mine drainage metagenome TaxID=410659 RepID=E6QFJ3_9ZZZZ